MKRNKKKNEGNTDKGRRTTITIVIIVFVLFGVALLLRFCREGKGTLPRELSDFAIEDTAQVTRVFLADKENNSVLLERKAGYWTANEKYIARKDAIDVLLKTMKQLSVKAPVAKAAHNTVVKNLSSNAIKVEIYNGKRLLKTYYVGNATQSQTGTYMLMEGSDVPFIMHIERFSGYLTSRFFTDELLWRSPSVFHCEFNKIKSVSVQHFNSERQSFKVLSYGDNKYGIMSLKDSAMLEKFDTVDVKFFLAHFKDLSYDQVVLKIDPDKKDSILHSQPGHIIKLEDIEGNIQNITTFRKKNPEGINPKTGFEYPAFDVDVMYGTMDGEELIMIQYFVFDPILVGMEYFTKKDEHKPSGT